MHAVEIWVLVDGDGNYAIGTDIDEAHEKYADVFGNITGGTRLVKIMLDVEVPATVEVKAILPVGAGVVNVRGEGNTAGWRGRGQCAS